MKILIYASPRSGSNLLKECLETLHGEEDLIIKTHDIDVFSGGVVKIYRDHWDAKEMNDVVH